jgi:hypothetical protein
MFIADHHAVPACREALLLRMSERSGLFASAYSQLAMWQHDMVAAGLKHTDTTMRHLTLALERLGAVEDCLQLAKLSEGTRPGDWTAHRAALRVSSGCMFSAWCALLLRVLHC